MKYNAHLLVPKQGKARHARAKQLDPLTRISTHKFSNWKLESVQAIAHEYGKSESVHHAALHPRDHEEDRALYLGSIEEAKQAHEALLSRSRERVEEHERSREACMSLAEGWALL